ncbi:MAG: hypothetical protein SF028_05660 [Candidatus Sumerlaeia bacterium]|nr:hypothetical protein [Candidatus Sumerlaeia bacterium]
MSLRAWGLRVRNLFRSDWQLYREAMRLIEEGELENARVIGNHLARRGYSAGGEILSVVAEEEDDWEGALRIAREAADRWPGSAALQERLGRMEMAEGNWTAAEAAFLEFRRLATDSDEPVLMLATNQARAGNIPAAEALLAESIDPGAAVHRARVWLIVHSEAGNHQGVVDKWAELQSRGETADNLRALRSRWFDARAGLGEPCEALRKEALSLRHFDKIEPWMLSFVRSRNPERASLSSISVCVCLPPLEHLGRRMDGAFCNLTVFAAGLEEAMEYCGELLGCATLSVEEVRSTVPLADRERAGVVWSSGLIFWSEQDIE